MKYVEPKVFLIAETKLTVSHFDFLKEIGVANWDTDAPSDSEKLIELAGKTCYMSFDKSLNKNLTRVRKNQNNDYIQNGIVKVDHGSVLEHASVTFAIHNVSRIFTHELVRHRAGCAFSQQSGRYVRTDEINAYMPKCLTNKENDLLAQALMSIELHYKNIEDQVFKRIPNDNFYEKKQVTSALRRLLPNGQVNTIIFTANHRALRHIIQMRTSYHAEEEIREVFEIIKDILIEEYPNIYEDLK